MHLAPLRTSAAVAIALVATALPVAGATGGAAEAAPSGADQAPSLLTDAPAPTGRVSQPSTDVERSRSVRLDAALFPAEAKAQPIEFNLFDDATYTGLVEERHRARGYTSWSGPLAGTGGLGYFDAVRVGETYLVHVASPEGVYEVSRSAGSTYRLTEVDQLDETTDDAERDVPGDDDLRPAFRPRSASATGAPIGDAGDTIDVFVVYTAQALAEAGGDANLAATIALAVSQTNSAFARSGVTTRMRLVGSGPSATTEVGGDLATDLARVRTVGDGFFDEAQGAREATHADLVSLVIGGTASTTCGRGYLGGSEQFGYTVGFRSCVTSNYTFAHEIGHNFGADHDLTASFPPTTPIPYAHGYVDLGARFYTVMAYESHCRANGLTDCVRLLNYSNPGVPNGASPTGNDGAQNARLINESAAVLASYRQSRIYPGAAGIGGTARVGGRLVAATGDWAPALLTFGYQWFVNGSPVPGATGPTFDPLREHLGGVVTLLVVGSAPGYATEQVATAGTPAIAKGRFRAGKPKVKGRHVVGSTLKVSIKKWQPNPKKAKYRWFRDGKKVKGASGKKYRVTRRDRGHKIVVRVTAKKPAYATVTRKSRKIRVRGR